MTKKNVLYVSGSLGLGHIVRDLAIASELKQRNSEVELSWLAAHPASLVLEEAGEKLLPEAEAYGDDNIPAEQAAQEGYQLDLTKYLMKATDAWQHNVEVFRQVTSKGSFDLVIADEAYEIEVALGNGQIQLEAPFVMIFDFIGNNALTWSPLERLVTYVVNRGWAKRRFQYDGEKTAALFVGEPDDIPDTGLGPLLPNRREVASAICRFVGYVIPFDPIHYKDQAKVRSKLGYGDEPLVICSPGGTAVGKDLLVLCGHAYPKLRERIPDVRMVLVCGPRVAPESLDTPNGVDVRGYIPALYEHFAASDLAIVQAGGTTTLELTALRRPFLYFPLEGHFEQQVHVEHRLARHKAGVKMSFRQTTPDSLVEQIISSLGKEVTCAAIRTDGAQRAAQLIDEFL